ncbi:MAG: hypothetical protein ACREBQ_09085, partial [Nitrososphaerales archaeon]
MKSEREKLLSEAVNLIQNHLQRVEKLSEPDSWNLGAYYSNYGFSKAKLSDEKIGQERESLLRESLIDSKKSVEILAKALPTTAVTAGHLAEVGRRCEDLGSTLAKLYDLSHRREDSLEAIKAFEEASTYYSKANLIGYLAPITWKIANIYDSIQEYGNSSSEFAKASEQYQKASENQKSLQKSFAELSLYMQAWSKIEESKLSHMDEDYLSSSEKLTEASALLKRTESFRFLSKHYEAYSKTEEAEDYSRKEKNLEAAAAFGSASKLFAQAELEATQHGKEADDIKWANLSKNRGKYCLTRNSLEEAKILDRNSQAEASMRKYKAASDALKELVGEASKTGNTSDVEALSLSCEAFATMKEAEVKSSPELYSKASEIFLKAKENNMKQSFVLSCLANAAICRAFEAGTKFKESNDAQLYSEIKSRLGAASRYYEEAGFEIASDWTGATEALFDALAYLSAAERQMDTSKKTQMYHLAEKHLELSARRYGDIG